MNFQLVHDRLDIFHLKLILPRLRAYNYVRLPHATWSESWTPEARGLAGKSNPQLLSIFVHLQASILFSQRYFTRHCRELSHIYPYFHIYFFGYCNSMCKYKHDSILPNKQPSLPKYSSHRVNQASFHPGWSICRPIDLPHHWCIRSTATVDLEWILNPSKSVFPRRLKYSLSIVTVTVTTRIIPFLVGNPYKPSFAAVAGRGDNPKYSIDTVVLLIVFWSHRIHVSFSHCHCP